MSDPEQNSGSAGAWYSAAGPEDDVVLSTRIRLARNLANFSFPENFRGDDSERVQTLVFDSFTHMADPENYQAVEIHNLDDAGTRILQERGVIDNPTGTGIVMRSDGAAACSVNSIDHVRISSFVSGLECDRAFSVCRSIDEGMQQSVQFAASYDFGFLTASLNDTGSGMKGSIRVHLPALSYSGKTDELLQVLQTKGFSLSACFGTGGIFTSALGAYYQIATQSAFSGSEIDQIVALTAIGKYITETERKIRTECAENKTTAVRDIVCRAYAAVKFSKLITLREAVEIISAIKWGHDMGFISNVKDCDLYALLYRIQEGHLGFLLNNGTFAFERDIEDDPVLKINRLRALILQEAFEKERITI